MHGTIHGHTRAQGLYAKLPGTLSTFVADLESLCRGGLVDTKYIADYHTRDLASYLEYLFRCATWLDSGGSCKHLIHPDACIGIGRGCGKCAQQQPMSGPGCT